MDKKVTVKVLNGRRSAEAIRVLSEVKNSGLFAGGVQYRIFFRLDLSRAGTL